MSGTIWPQILAWDCISCWVYRQARRRTTTIDEEEGESDDKEEGEGEEGEESEDRESEESEENEEEGEDVGEGGC